MCHTCTQNSQVPMLIVSAQSSFGSQDPLGSFLVLMPETLFLDFSAANAAPPLHDILK